MRHALIMAGGSGTRLWPLSRRQRPKQLLKLFNGASLLQHSRRRVEGLFAPHNIWVITSAEYLDLVAEQLPDVPRANLLGEPVGRDTANAIGLAAHVLAQRDPGGTMAVFTADHLISPQDEFADAIEIGLAAAEQFPDSLVTFGIIPDSPHTGYGYVHRGEPVGEGAYQVVAFREKPSRDVAQSYVQSGEYFWNSGMFAWQISAILAELERCLPENHRTLAELARHWPNLAGTDQLADAFAGLKRISIDFGVMEKAGSVLVVEMNCRWLDLGSWSSIAETREPDSQGNFRIAPLSLILDGSHNIVIGEPDHLIAIMGLDDLVVVHGEDATLICRREHEQQIRELTKLRQKQFGERFE
ncbi:MAG: mannose-1-phosphate guanylyltransferase [Planctomycetes bacterium]|nr:mannose-1-phosphate guanylyltransferase [Planctomycetota bacterium]